MFDHVPFNGDFINRMGRTIVWKREDRENRSFMIVSCIMYSLLKSEFIYENISPVDVGTLVEPHKQCVFFFNIVVLFSYKKAASNGLVSLYFPMPKFYVVPMI